MMQLSSIRGQTHKKTDVNLLNNKLGASFLLACYLSSRILRILGVNGPINNKSAPTQFNLFDMYTGSPAEKFENAALFLRLDLPSALIRHENGAFRKRSWIETKGWIWKAQGFHFCEDAKHFDNGAFRKRCRHYYHVSPWPIFPQQ